MHLEETSTRARELSPGIAIGNAHVVRENNTDPGVQQQIDIDGELRRFDREVNRISRELADLHSRVSHELDAEDADIIQAHQMMVADKSLKKKVVGLIAEEGLPMETAVRRVLQAFARRMEASADEYLRQRANDFIDLAGYFRGAAIASCGHPEARIDQETIFVVAELLPSIVLSCQQYGAAGILAESGAPVSHAAILARSFGIPVLIGTFPFDDPLQDGEAIIMDGQKGVLIRRPEPSTLHHYQKQVQCQPHPTKGNRQIGESASKTRDDTKIDLGVNLGGLDELLLFSPQEVDAVGLFRTEFLFMFDQKDFPSFDQQVQWYSRILKHMQGRPVTFRALDVGGDKFLPYFQMGTQSNPYLGLRAHRVFRYHPEILETQLQAILEAAAFGPVRILYPMINSLEDIDYLNGILLPLRAAQRDIEVGVMVETPAAVVMIREILKKVDFVSIGTNDLVQYTLAVDRNNENVMSFYQPLHPVILRMIQTIVKAAEACGKPVSVCGEIASDPRWTPLLLGIGIRSMSMAPLQVPSIRQQIRSLHLPSCRDLVGEILSVDYLDEVERILDKFTAKGRHAQAYRGI